MEKTFEISLFDFELLLFLLLAQSLPRATAHSVVSVAAVRFHHISSWF